MFKSISWIQALPVSFFVLSIITVLAFLLPSASIQPHALPGIDWTQCRTEQGTTTVASGSTVRNLTLATAVTDLSQAFLIVDVSGTSGVNGGREHMVSGYISNATTLTFERTNTTGTVEVSYALVECFNNEFDVQRGEITLGGSVQSNTAAISSVDTSRSMVIVSSRTTDTANAEDEALVTGELQDATTVLVERSSTHASTTTVRYEVVEFDAGTGVTVQTAEVTFGPGASTTDTITSVDTTRSWLYCSWDATNNGLRQTAVGCELTNATTVTFSRFANSSYTNRIRYYVVQFPTNTVTVEHGQDVTTNDSCTNNQQCNSDVSITPISSITKAFAFATNTTNGSGTSFPRNRWIQSFLNTSTLRRSTWMASSATSDNGTGYWQVIEFPQNIEVEQEAYRWFSNVDSTDVGGPLAAQDTAATLGAATPFRLRALFDIETGQYAAGAVDLKLQFAVRSGACDTSFTGEVYTDVTGATDIAYHNNATPADGDALTANGNDPTGGDTVVNQTYEELNDFTTTSTIPVGQDGLWDFALTDNGAPNSTTYCFRFVTAAGGLLDTYSVIPEITTFSGNAAPTGVFNTASQKTDGSKTVDISIEVDDGEDDDTRALIEFDTDAACNGPWTKVTLDESGGAVADFDDSGGPPSVVNADAYQVGSSATERVITSSGSNSVDVDWDVSADAASVEATYCLRLTVNDDTSDQSPPATQTIPIDTADPAVVTAGVSPSVGVVEAGEIVTIDIDMGESGLVIGSAGCTVNGKDVSATFLDDADDTYELQYAPVQGDSSWAPGALPISCQLQDAFGNAVIVSAFTDGNTLEGDIASGGGGGGSELGCPNILNVRFSINDGASVTGSQAVTLSINQQNATQILYSDSISFAGAQWEPVQAQIPFVLTGTEGEKTVYMQLRNSCRTGLINQDSIIYTPGADGPETQPSEEDTDLQTPPEPEVDEEDDNQAPPPIISEPADAVGPDTDEIVGGFIVVRSVVQDDAPEALEFATRLASEVDDAYTDGTISFRSGTLVGETRRIIGYLGDTRTILVDPPFSGVPANGDEFTIVKSLEQVTTPTAPTVIVTPSPLPTQPEEIALLPISQQEAVASLSQIDADLDVIRSRASDSMAPVGDLANELSVSAQQMIDTLLSVGAVNLNSEALEKLADFDESDVQSFLDVQNKIADLRALSIVARRLLENGASAPVSESYMTFGSLQFTFMLANPLSTPTTMHVSSFLPEEIRPEHVLADGGLNLAFAPDAGVYYAVGDVEVDPGELLIRRVEVRDIWMVSEDEVSSLLERADDLNTALSGTRFAPQAVLLAGSMEVMAQLILETQAESYVSPQEHILIYRENRVRLDEMRADLDQLEAYALQAQFGEGFGISTSVVFWSLSALALVVAILMILVTVLWRRESRLLGALVEMEKHHHEKSKKSSSPPRKRSGRTLTKAQRKKMREVQLVLLTLALGFAVAAAAFFVIEEAEDMRADAQTEGVEALQ